MKNKQNPKIVVSKEFKKKLESFGKKADTYEDIIKKFIKTIRVTKSDGKISEGIFHSFLNDAIMINIPDKDKSEYIPFKIIKKIEEIK